MLRNVLYTLLSIVFIIAYIDLIDSCKAIDEAIEQSVQYQDENDEIMKQFTKTVLLKIQK